MPARKVFLIVLMTASIVSCSLAGSGSGTVTPGGPSGGVSISGFAFHPGTVTTSSGVTLTWTNSDGTAHTVTETAGSQAFDSGDIPSGSSYSLTLTLPGTYAYKCKIHAGMTGTIVVQ
jgi:plastocyanin